MISKVTYLVNYCKYNKFPWNYNFQIGLDKQIKNNIQRLYQTYDYSAFEYINVKVSTLIFFNYRDSAKEQHGEQKNALNRNCLLLKDNKNIWFCVFIEVILGVVKVSFCSQF